MHPSDSIRTFEQFATEAGVELFASNIEVGIDLMFSFYQAIKPDDCDPDNGDMLLFEWGTYDWGHGENFQVGITRQFIETGKEDDDAISQLSLTYLFEPTDAARSLGGGNRWCDGPSEFEIVKAFALSSAAVGLIAGTQPKEVQLRHSYM